MTVLDQKIEQAFIRIGMNPASIALIRDSEFAVGKWNKFAVDIGAANRTVDEIVATFIRRGPLRSGTYQGQLSLNGDELPYVVFDPESLDSRSSVVYVALGGSHELGHTEQALPFYSGHSDPESFAAARRDNEGLSQLAEWVHRLELVSSDKLLNFRDFTASDIWTNTDGTGVHDKYNGEATTYKNSLVAAGKSPAQVDQAMIEFWSPRLRSSIVDNQGISLAGGFSDAALKGTPMGIEIERVVQERVAEYKNQGMTAQWLAANDAGIRYEAKSSVIGDVINAAYRESHGSMSYMSATFANLVGQFNSGSTAPGLTYNQANIRDYVAARIGLPSLSPSNPAEIATFNYLPPVTGLTVFPDRSWEVIDWRVKGLFGGDALISRLRDGTIIILEERNGTAVEVVRQQGSLTRAQQGLIMNVAPAPSDQNIVRSDTGLSLAFEARGGHLPAIRLLGENGEVVSPPEVEKALQGLVLSREDVYRGLGITKLGDKWIVSYDRKNGDGPTVSTRIEIGSDGSSVLSKTHADGVITLERRDALQKVVAVGVADKLDENTSRSRWFDSQGEPLEEIRITRHSYKIVKTVTDADGNTTTATTDLQGNPMGPIVETLSHLDTFAGAINDTTALINAIKAGKPLPVLVSGLKLANEITKLNDAKIPSLNTAATVGSAALSIYSLSQALKSGDGLAAVSSAAQTLAADRVDKGRQAGVVQAWIAIQEEPDALNATEQGAQMEEHAVLHGPKMDLHA